MVLEWTNDGVLPDNGGSELGLMVLELTNDGVLPDNGGSE